MNDNLKLFFDNCYIKRDGFGNKSEYRIYRLGTYGRINQIAMFRTFGEAVAYAEEV